MQKVIKTQKEILSKLGIKALNPMQEEAELAIKAADEVVLLSPTGSGKTLAFLLPIIAALDSKVTEVQALIIAPSRELAIQIEQVVREMGSGYKTNVFYGGRNFSKDQMELNTTPSIIVGTPGRIADHLRRKTFSTDKIRFLVLDEFDKSLEIGFDEDMIDICEHVPEVEKKILTSATNKSKIPGFVNMANPIVIDCLSEHEISLSLKRVESPIKDKLDSLVDLLKHIGNKPGIIFCNFKDSIQRISDHLAEFDIDHGCFYGGLEQKDRERALIKFRNGTHQLLLATDLAARGLDVPEIKFIIHYHLPVHEKEFTHRNGRTARMHKEGTAYVLHYVREDLPDFINIDEVEEVGPAPYLKASPWSTIFISGGRKDKISKGDIVGLLMKQGNLEKDEVGHIELKTDCAFVSVHKSKLKALLPAINNTRLKKKKVRITEI